MRSRVCAKCGAETKLRAMNVTGSGAAAVSVEVDRCDRCRGVWLDWGEVGELKDLEQLIPGMTGNASWRRDLEGGNCPSCPERHELLRLAVGAFGVDRCPECLGLWFDGGELGPLLTDEGFAALLKALRSHPV